MITPGRTSCLSRSWCFQRLHAVVAPLFLAAAFALMISGCRAPEQRTSDIELRLEPPPPPQVDVVLLLDQSGSMFGPNGTDPNGVRAEAAKYLVANISEKSAEDAPNRVAVLDFGDKPAREGVSLTVVTAYQGVDALTKRIATQNMGSTNVIDALRAAHRSLKGSASYTAGRRPRIVLFTDGKPEDNRNLQLATYFEEIKQFIRSTLQPNDCKLYVIAVDEKGNLWDECAPYWLGILGKDHVVRIHNVDELRGTFNSVVNSIFGIPRVRPEIITRGRKSFDIPPCLDRLEFHIFPSTPHVTLRIRRPDNSFVAPDKDQNVRRRKFPGYEIISVYDPAPGTWRYEMVKGKGVVEIYRNEVPLSMKLLLPKPVHALGKPIQIVADFARHNGKPVTSYSDYPLGLSGRITAPTGEVTKVLFEVPFAGHYYGNRAATTKVTGVYKITLQVQVGKAFDSSVTYDVEVAKRPYFEVRPPRLRGLALTAKELEIEAELKLAGKACKPETQFTNHPDRLLLAQLVSMPGKRKSRCIWLSRSGENRFSGVFPLPTKRHIGIALAQPGIYVVQVEDAGELRTGEKLEPHDVTLCKTEIQPRTSVTMALTLIQCAVVLYLALVILSWVRLCAKLILARKMQVNVVVRHSQSQAVLAQLNSINKRRMVTRTKTWKPEEGERGARVRPRLLFVWGFDRLGQWVGIGYVWCGLARVQRLHRGSSVYVGRLKIEG